MVNTSTTNERSRLGIIKQTWGLSNPENRPRIEITTNRICFCHVRIQTVLPYLLGFLREARNLDCRVKSPTYLAQSILTKHCAYQTKHVCRSDSTEVLPVLTSHVENKDKNHIKQLIICTTSLKSQI